MDIYSKTSLAICSGFCRIASHIRRRHLLQEGCFSLVRAKTRSWNGFWGIQRALYDFDKPENITDLCQQSNRTNWKKSVIRTYRKPLELVLKLKTDPASCRVLSPIVWHKIRWYPLKIEKSVFQTNNPTEIKTQGTMCQGPDDTIYVLSYTCIMIQFQDHPANSAVAYLQNFYVCFHQLFITKPAEAVGY